MARKRVALKDPAHFSDPANLTWERYVAMQARERERYLAERTTIPEDALNYKNVSPRYLKNAVDQFANNYYSELSATHYVATAAANAPFDELKKSALFQLADEQRHLEMDREVFERAGIPERDWLAAWESPGTTCRFFRHLLELEDSIEILVKGNFVAEGAAGPGTFTVLADGAEARGDVLSAVNHRARIRDETRSRTIRGISTRSSSGRTRAFASSPRWLGAASARNGGKGFSPRTTRSRCRSGFGLLVFDRGERAPLPPDSTGFPRRPVTRSWRRQSRRSKRVSSSAP